MRHLLLLSLLLLSSTSFGMGAIRKFCENNPKICGKDEEPEPEEPIPHPCEPCVETPECGPVPDECHEEPEPEPSDFDWSLVKQYGGNGINIAKDIGSWAVTRQMSNVEIKGGKLYSKLDGKAYAPDCTDIGSGVSGNFAACVKQDDGKYICGTWDWCRSSYQTVKTMENLEGSMGDSFGLKHGSEICVFYTGCSRAKSRNVLERSNLTCLEWK